MRKFILIGTLLLIIIILASGWFDLSYKNSQEPGVSVNNFEECIAKGYPVLESYPRQCRTPDGKTFIEDIGNELEKQNLIRVSKPRPNEIVESPLKSATLPFAVPSASKGKLILEKDNPSGLPEHADELIIPVYFKEAPETSQKFMTVKIFLSDSRFAGEPYFDCSRTIAVERQVPQALAVARTAVEALLRGATEEEINQGFVSSINSGARIQSLIIENGVAKVDFDEQLEFQVGGSCRVAAIRAQITQTLKQFPTVNSVIISIDGRTEDILQP